MEAIVTLGALVGMMIFVTVVTKKAENLALTEGSRQAVLEHLIARLSARRTYENAVVVDDLDGRRVRVFAEVGIAQKNPWEEWIIVVEGELGETEPFLIDPLGPVPVQITRAHIAEHAGDDGLARALHDGSVRAALEDAVQQAPLLSVRGKKGGPLVVIVRATGATPQGIENAASALARFAVALSTTRPRLTTAIATMDGAATSPSGSPLPVPRIDR